MRTIPQRNNKPARPARPNLLWFDRGSHCVVRHSAVADEGPRPLRDTKPVEKQGSSSAVPSNPNSRLGRMASPLAQGRDRMDGVIVGIDVAKDKLDVGGSPVGRTVCRRENRGGA